MRPLLSLTLLTCCLAAPSWSQTVQGVDPHVFARPSDGGLVLQWNALANSSSVTIRRLLLGRPDAGVVVVAMLDAGATSWVEPVFDAGTRAIYRVQRNQQGGFGGEAVVLAGVEAPFIDDPGVVLVLVDDVNSVRLRSQLDQAVRDLRDDGFEVVEQAVPRTETPPQVKDRIIAVAAGATGRRVQVMLLGAIPRAFSGLQNPDGHPDHYGAWPADPYYADLSGLNWTDTSRGGVGAFFNDAGDGKFDQSYTSAVEVVVGRVDFEGLPVFGADAGTGLLGRYLDKVHRFRTGAAPLPRRALVRPGFGYFSGEAFGRAAYRDGTAILGVEPVDAPFFPTLEQDGGVLLAWGDGAGGPTSASGVTNSTELAMRVPQTRLMALFGSYFGDWSYSNALMRTALGSGEVVASFWYARPSVQVYGLGALESFGQSYARDTSFAYRSMPVYQALLGDPTLRLFYPSQVTSLAAQPGVSGVQLSWPPYTNRDFIGYHVYRRSLAGGIAGRLTATPVSTESFLDTTALPSTTYEWRVVAVVRETTGSGTFWNHSLGARSVAMTLAVPDAGVPSVDAGSIVDGGASVDAGSFVDGGSVADAGSFVDGGSVVDAGSIIDAGSMPDGGSVAEDAGVVADAGALEDAGSFVDAGAADAGSVVGSDAGSMMDAGFVPLPLEPMPTDPNPAVGGCGCSGAGGVLPMLTLIALIRRRRR
ncbi:MAG: fibronectin type III domain-containing protein [Archangiaceae bacterium]|nr:fibronectin type III domain-containing protein [Archangiaceae bacterium]